MKPYNFNSQTQQDFIALSTYNCGTADSSVHNHPLPRNSFTKTLRVTCFLIIPASTASPTQPPHFFWTIKELSQKVIVNYSSDFNTMETFTQQTLHCLAERKMYTFNNMKIK